MMKFSITRVVDEDKTGKGKVAFGTLEFDSGKKILLDSGEVREFNKRLKLAKAEGKLGREIGTDGLTFTCPDCGHDRLECCEDGPYSSIILNLDEEGDFDYDEINASGEVVRYQCVQCGTVLPDVTCNEEVIEWIKENC